MIPFTKTHACGNDFLIITEKDAAGYDKAELAQRLCERNTSIGADGIEFFEWTGDFSGRIRLYNADGSIAEISGNGTRCVAAWMAEELNSQVGDELSIETDAGVRICTIDGFRESEDDAPTTLVTTDMDVPEFEETTVELSDGTVIEGVFVSMGNPHFVILLDSIDSPPDAPQFMIGDRVWQEIGEEICFHPDFPEQTNVEFVRTLRTRSDAPNQVALRIYERGVGPTSSSGTGTSATATAMIAIYGASSPLDVAAPGGIQTVEWAGPGERLYLTGPATLIARGEAW
ncbi:diaminopimelate epimerase [Acidicapsa ligni]|uniref:diaminopimelate epimerase n=1 Tax=Acidicapsa ligni TaxID=542300 RepID=UPI0021E0BE43|nr:diaminopimelate epimerase [Acidicapsa ligni]